MKKNIVGIAVIIGLALVAALGTHLIDLSSLGLATFGLALASAPVVLSEEQVKEFQGILGELKGGWAELKPLPASFRSLQDETAQLKQHVTDVRRLLASLNHGPSASRKSGGVSNACAGELAARFIA